jgi:leucyl/phenylalanyl-tRNA--protein transferase
MAEDRHDTTLYWVDPDERGIIPLNEFHIPKRLARRIKRDEFSFSIDCAFPEVMKSCAAPARGRESTWISSQIIELYSDLHARGHVHSVECWDGENLIGGLYGVSLGAAFFGESMFSRQTDASKAALVFLVGLLRHLGFQLLDTQFLTDHLEQFGATEISRKAYRKLLNNAVYSPGASSVEFSGENSDWFSIPVSAPVSEPGSAPSTIEPSRSGMRSTVTGARLLQSISQTS